MDHFSIAPPPPVGEGGVHSKGAHDSRDILCIWTLKNSLFGMVFKTMSSCVYLLLKKKYSKVIQFVFIFVKVCYFFNSIFIFIFSQTCMK